MSSRLWEYWQVCTYTLFFSLFSTFLQVIAHRSRKNSNEHYRQTPSCWITSPVIFPLLYRHALQNHDHFATWIRSLFFFWDSGVIFTPSDSRAVSSTGPGTVHHMNSIASRGLTNHLTILLKNLPISAPFPLLSDHNHKWLCVDHFGKKCPIDMCWTTGSQ